MQRKRALLAMPEKTGDITSMIDIVFLLLIFFILMPFRVVEAKLESHLPKTGPDKRNKVKIDLDKIIISIVRKDNHFNLHTLEGMEVKFNGGKLSHFSNIKVRLNELRQSLDTVQLTEIPVEINADEDVPFYFVLKALDYAKVNGYLNIKFPEPPQIQSSKKPRRVQ